MPEDLLAQSGLGVHLCPEVRPVHGQQHQHPVVAGRSDLDMPDPDGGSALDTDVGEPPAVFAAAAGIVGQPERVEAGRQLGSMLVQHTLHTRLQLVWLVQSADDGCGGAGDQQTGPAGGAQHQQDARRLTGHGELHLTLNLFTRPAAPRLCWAPFVTVTLLP